MAGEGPAAARSRCRCRCRCEGPPEMAVQWTPIRLMMEEDEKQLTSENKHTLNGGVSAVTVRETTTEGIIRQKAKYQISQIGRKELEEAVAGGWPGRGPRGTTTVTLEAPPRPAEYSFKGTWEREKFLKRPARMVDVECSTDLSVPLVRVTPAEDAPGAAPPPPPLPRPPPHALPSQPNVEPKIDSPGGDQALEQPIEPPKKILLDEAVPVIDDKGEKVDKNNDDSCLVDCLYYTLQCCECNLM